MCGENSYQERRLADQTGSSPRVRGKLVYDLDANKHTGLIPACAGKTRRKTMPQAMHRAHPRVCGENRPRCGFLSQPQGSSPRVRGKHPESSRDVATIGLIPACAGKTFNSVQLIFYAWAHPRVCGENNRLCLHSNRIRGSSPRVRGKLQHRRRPPRNLGLIPACAGKTGKWLPLLRLRWAHPRVCGENSWGIRPLKRRLGSSPRVRGKR